MARPFRLLRVFSVLFKVAACGMLVLMAVTLVGVMTARNPQVGWREMIPVVLNLVFSSLLGFLVFYAAGEVIRLLLAIESRTRGPGSP